MTPLISERAALGLAEVAAALACCCRCCWAAATTLALVAVPRDLLLLYNLLYQHRLLLTASGSAAPVHVRAAPARCALSHPACHLCDGWTKRLAPLLLLPLQCPLSLPVPGRAADDSMGSASLMSSCMCLPLPTPHTWE